MAKRLLLNVLVQVLGEFIDINEENLNLAVWSGQIVLHNLKLKTDKLLRDFNLTIVHGIVHTLEITIPWASLLKNPIKIKINGIYLQVSPLDMAQFDKAEIMKRKFDEKIQKLQLVDRYFELASSLRTENPTTNVDTKTNNDNESESYIQQWSTKIIENIEINLTSMHLRYEDSLTLPGKVFSVGVTLESFDISTCDDNWQTSSTSSLNSSNKLAYTKSLGLYWQTSSKGLSSLSVEEWKSTMQSLIYSKTPRSTVVTPSSSLYDMEKYFNYKDLQYILSPINNNLFIKLVHNKKASMEIPKYDIIIECTNLQLIIDGLQYTQLFNAIDRVGAVYQSCESSYFYRPQNRPGDSLRANKQWWKYACKLVIKQPKYIKLIKLVRKAESSPVHLQKNIFTANDNYELKILEERISFDTLKIFRQKAIYDIAEEMKKKNKSGNGWFGGWFGKSQSEDEDNVSGSFTVGEDISIDSIIASLNQQDSAKTKTSNNILFVKMSLSSSSSLVLSNNWSPIIRSQMTLNCSFSMSSSDLSLKCELKDFSILDKCSRQPPIPCILSVKEYNTDSQLNTKYPCDGNTVDNLSPTFLLEFEKSNGKSHMKLFSLPVEICLNRTCIQTLYNTFSRPENIFTKKNNYSKKMNLIKKNNKIKGSPTLGKQQSITSIAFQQIVSTRKDDMEITIEVYAPKIIIPEDCSKDEGYLLLDTGHLSMKGFFGSSGMSLNISITDINAGMPLKIFDKYSISEKSLYLIKPFHIVLQVQNIEQSLSDMTVSVELKPELRGSIDSVKLSRLLRVLKEVSVMFSKTNNSISESSPRSGIIKTELSNESFDKVNTESFGFDLSDYENSDGYATPDKLSNSRSGKKIFKKDPSNSSLDNESNYKLSRSDPSDEITANVERKYSNPSHNVLNQDPTRNNITMTITLPIIALDLTYDIEEQYHLELAIKLLVINIVTRAYDKQILLDLNEFSIKDSFRHPKQSYLVYTPADFGNLVHISYKNMNSRYSPYFSKYATEVQVDFAQLVLNTDVSTINHLKPFFDVLLAKTPPKEEDSKGKNLSIESIATNKNVTLNEINPDIPTGMLIIASMGRLTLDMLRVPKISSYGTELDESFSIEVSKMTLNIEMKDLMTADLDLVSFRIFDRRIASKDYEFRTIICPITDNYFSHDEKTDTDDFMIHSYNAEIPMTDQTQSLLRIVYSQESKSHSYITLTISNTASFISLDTALDLVYIASANFFALLGLFSGPPSNQNNQKISTSKKDVIIKSSISSPPQTAAGNNTICSTMNVIAKINNPKLILLEDPTKRDSQAIVGGCSIEVHYTREGRTNISDNIAISDLYESIHLTVFRNEAAVIKNMLRWSPQSILEPFDIEIHLKRKSTNGAVIYNHIHMEIENVDARISFNDMVLAKNILSRRTLTEGTANNSNKNKNIPSEENIVVKNNIDHPVSEANKNEIPLLIHFGLSSLSAVAINDFNGQNIPVLKLLVDDMKLYVEGDFNSNLTGDGSMEVKVDFYNSFLYAYEPLLDHWKPTLNIVTVDAVNILEIKCDHTMQITLSGALLETFLRSYSLFFYQNDIISRKFSSHTDITVYNLLGDNIGIELFDSVTQNPLITIDPLSSGGLVKVEHFNKKINNNKYDQIPNAIDIHFLGPLRHERQPLLNLQFNSAQPKAFNLQPITLQSDDKTLKEYSDMNLFQKSSRATINILEPIIEEVYENSRYDPLSGAWSPPFLLGDPFQWTDASGSIRKDIGSIELPSNKWIWQDKWDADFNGIIGKEIDSDGWEYGSSFNNFSIVNLRRIMKSMDCVRRRRWTRTRVPVPENINDNSLRPLTAFWDISILENGSRKVELRSGFQIVNELSFGIIISLRHDTWPNEVEFGPINIGEKFSVPLLNASANWIRIKPDFPCYEWSNYYQCNSQSYDFSIVKESLCKGFDEASATYFRIISVQKYKSLTVKLIPFVILSNVLPCAMIYRISNVVDSVIEEGDLLSGNTVKLSHINFSSPIGLSIKLGNHSWSNSVVMKHTQTGMSINHFELSNIHNNDSKLILVMKSKLQSHSITIKVFSKCLLLDKTNLDLSICSKNNNGDQVIRSTWSELDCTSIFFSSKIQQTESPTPNESYMSNKIFTKSNEGMMKTWIPDPSIDLIEKMSYNSSGNYSIGAINVGKNVYTDCNIKWKYLPLLFHNQIQIQTPFEDMMMRSKVNIEIEVKFSCLLFLFVDVSYPPNWLELDGYKAINDIAVAESIENGILEEYHFSIYAKYHSIKNGSIILRGNGSKFKSCMYSVILIPDNKFLDETSSVKLVSLKAYENRLLDEINIGDNSYRDLTNQSWTEGSSHVSMFYPSDDLISLGIVRGTVWSEDLNIDAKYNHSNKSSIEIEDEKSNILYQLSYSTRYLPGLYSESQLLVVMPRYCVLNCVDESLYVSQKGSDKFCEYKSYQPNGWHKLNSSLGTLVQFRVESSIWSLGAIDLNEVGASVLLLPERTKKNETSSDGIVLHIEVKLADPNDNCSIIIVVWRETRESKSAILIQNDSDVPVTIRQAEIELDHNITDKLFLYETVVWPNQKTPFGWADPECSSFVLIAVGENMIDNNKRIANINLLKNEQILRLPYNLTKYGGGINEVVVSVLTVSGGGQVIQISKIEKFRFLNIQRSSTSKDCLEELLKGDKEIIEKPLSNGFGISLLLSSFGVSLVVEKPTRRELFSLYVDGLELTHKVKNNLMSFEFNIMDLQIDNYSETVIYPVLLRSKKKEIHKSFNISEKEESDLSSISEKVDGLMGVGPRKFSNNEQPFIKSVLIIEFPRNNSPIFKYFALRMLSLAVEVDSATVQVLYLDLLDDLKLLNRSQALALSLPDRWIEEFNRSILTPMNQIKIIDIYNTKIRAQKSKIYFKNLVIHPIKLTVTFIQTLLPRKKYKETLQSTALNIFTALVGVEKLQLKLNSFQVEDATESWQSLIDLIVNKASQDVRYQLTNIAGSLAMIGSPIGFARKVGNGVKSFFYEPYLGAVHGSQNFFAGLGKGTSNLVTGVITGFMDSTVAFVGTATQSISHFTGDTDYIRQRSIVRQKNRANRGGIMDGITAGSESILSGVTSGVTGLISKPVEEAYRNGLSGFIQGVGLGIIGLAVKPVMGIADGIVTVANGISNVVDPIKIYIHVRPPRALEPSVIDSSRLIIVPLNLDAAFAQEFVLKRGKENHYDDSFISFIPLEKKGESIILSQVYFYWRKQNSLWGRMWANISHCVFMVDAIGMMLYSGGQGGGPELVVIPCHTVAIAKRVYTYLAANAFKMGNPSNVIPVEIILNSLDSNDKNVLNRNSMSRITDASLLGTLNGYRFGSVNNSRLQQIVGSEGDVLTRAKYHVEKGFKSWKELDESIWTLLWEWGCIHSSFCRCSVSLFINHSDIPIQISRVQMVLGRNVVMMGSSSTGYEIESRCILPKGVAVIFICAYPQSPLEVGHLNANINTAAFSATVSSLQRETVCESKGGFTVGFLEKTATDWWSKYVIIIT